MVVKAVAGQTGRVRTGRVGAQVQGGGAPAWPPSPFDTWNLYIDFTKQAPDTTWGTAYKGGSQVAAHTLLTAQGVALRLTSSGLVVDDTGAAVFSDVSWLSSTAGTVFVAYQFIGLPDNAVDANLVRLQGGDEIVIAVSQFDNTTSLFVSGGDNGDNIQTDNVYGPGSKAAATWQAGAQTFYIDGSSRGSGAMTLVPDGLNAAYLGTDGSGDNGNNTNCIIKAFGFKTSVVAGATLAQITT